MKRLFVFIMFIACASSCWTAAAQTTGVEASVVQVVEEFKGAQGVHCIALRKGEGLGLIKELFKAKFGKAFMKDVTFVALIDYTKASADTYKALRAKLDSLSSTLHEFKTEDNTVKEGQCVKSFATLNSDTSISDFMIITEDKEQRIYIYMGGILNLDKLELQL